MARVESGSCVPLAAHGVPDVVRRRNARGATGWKLGLSVGVTVQPADHRGGVYGLLERADEQMYAMKRRRASRRRAS